MKILFVTHDISIYGAAKSLALLIKSIKEDVECHLLINKRLLGKNNLVEVSRRFEVPVDRIYEAHLPFMLCEIGKPKKNLYWYLKQSLWKLNSHSLNNILNSSSFDVVHLNSIVLYPLLRSDNSFVMHIREIFDYSTDEIYRYLNRAKGVIYIDSATQTPFLELESPLQYLLENPFDQTELKKYALDRQNTYLRFKDKVVFSLIGIIKPTKGQLFVIEAFNQLQGSKAILLIVGKSTDIEYYNLCKEAAASNPSIIFCGEESEIDKVYCASDYIIRAESYPCMGRTVKEALFSDCGVIIQGCAVDYGDSFTTFSTQVSFYEPRDSVTNINVMESVIRLGKRKKSHYRSNLNEYRKSVINIFRKVSMVKTA